MGVGAAVAFEVLTSAIASQVSANRIKIDCELTGGKNHKTRVSSRN